MNFRGHLSTMIAQAEARDALDLAGTSADALAASTSIDDRLFAAWESKRDGHP